MTDTAPPVDATIEIYRSRRENACLERALVLDAVGIRNVIRNEAPFYLLMVDGATGTQAREQLALYEQERRAPSVLPPRPALHEHAWLGTLTYVLLLIAIGLTVSNGVWGAGAFDAGTLDAEKVQAGQWWRAITALTLHLDGEHLAGNLLIGAWFGHLLGRQLGPGHAWCLVLLGAGASNLIEASLLPAPYQAVGASTAVFTALGLACAYSWGTHTRWAQSWAARWTPLICGVLLLTWLGSGGNDSAGEVDVAAHAMGFTLGLLLGIAVARSRLQPLLARIPQWTTGLVALGGIAVAWSLALRTVT